MNTLASAITLTGTSPSSATTSAGTAVAIPMTFAGANKVVVDAVLAGGTGGTLDVYIQRQTGVDEWKDLIHFPQLAAGASKKYTCVIADEAAAIVETGGGTTAAPGVALAANTVVNVIPQSNVRFVFVAGAGTSAGAAQTVKMLPYLSKD